MLLPACRLVVIAGLLLGAGQYADAAEASPAGGSAGPKRPLKKRLKREQTAPAPERKSGAREAAAAGSPVAPVSAATTSANPTAAPAAAPESKAPPAGLSPNAPPPPGLQPSAEQTMRPPVEAAVPAPAAGADTPAKGAPPAAESAGADLPPRPPAAAAIPAAPAASSAAAPMVLSPAAPAAAPPTSAPPIPPMDAGAAPVELALFSLESQIAKIAVASKREEALDDTPGSVTVITKEQIRDMNALTLRDVLNVLVPGIDVVPTYFRYGDRVNEGIYSRGLLSDFSQQVLILFNGQTKWNETTFASPFVAVQFNLENIERIEISRSPVPIQGGGALTVINLVTKEQYLHNSGQAYLDLSTNERDFTGRFLQGLRVTGLYGIDLGPLRASGSVQYYQDAGQAHRESAGRGGYRFDPSTLRDGVKNAANFTLSLQSRDERFSLQSCFQHTNSDAFLSGQVPSQSNDLYKYQGTIWVANLRVKPWRKLQLLAGTMLAQWTNITDIAGAPGGGGESNFNVYVEGNYEFQFRAAGRHSLLTGLRLEREGQFSGVIYTFDSEGLAASDDPALLFAPNAARNVFALYADDVWRAVAGKLLLTGGVRLDVYNGFGDANEFAPSGRFAMLYNPSRALGIKLLYATAIRPPSIYERLGTTLLPLRGSESITSERVHTVEVSLIAKVKQFKLQLTPFFEWFNDKIEYVPEGTTFTAHNNGATRVLGFDVDARYHFTPDSYLFANGSYVNSYDLQNQNQTYFLPSVYVNAGGNLHYRGFNLNATFYFRDKRPLPQALVQNLEHTSYHAMLNAAVAYSFWKGMRVYLLVENVTDQQNNIPLSIDQFIVPMRGRTVHLGLSLAPGLNR